MPSRIESCSRLPTDRSCQAMAKVINEGLAVFAELGSVAVGLTGSCATCWAVNRQGNCWRFCAVCWEYPPIPPNRRLGHNDRATRSVAA